jgi:anaerobic magnesium-protoporphyrin IX monomethyl ester cyclase
MRVALVKPCWKYPIAGAEHTYNRRWPPLELLNCAAILEADGHEVSLVDAHAEGLAPERAAERVGAADLAVVTSSALDRWQCPNLELAPVRALCARLGGRAGRVVLTGFHGTVEPETMLAIDGVDAVVRGEPEPTVRELAAGRPWEDVAGLAFRRAGQTLVTPDREPLDMARLPVPAFHLLDLRRYRYEVLGPRFLVLEGSRGCPCACTFCSRVIQGRRPRRKTPEQLGREAEIAVRQFGARSIYFIDLEFTAARTLVEGLCRYLAERRVRVRWCCQTRTDQVDEALLAAMRAAGCRLIHFGIETGSPRIARAMRKPILREQHRRALAAARRQGIETLCFFLLGYPGETPEEMHQTVRLARELDPTYASFHRVSPYAGSPLFDQSADGRGEPFPAFAGSHQARAEVDRAVRRAFWSFYVRPRYVAGRLLRSSPASLWRQLRLFAGYFR